MSNVATPAVDETAGAKNQTGTDTPHYTPHCRHSCQCITNEFALAQRWAESARSRYAYRIGSPGKRIPSCWLTVTPDGVGAVVTVPIIESDIFHFLYGLHDTMPCLNITPNRLRSIRLLAKFMLTTEGK